MSTLRSLIMGNTDRHLDKAEAITGPLLMHLGEEDEFISKDAQARIKAAFRDRPSAEIHSYPGCSHAFARHSGAHFDAAAAALANARTYAFLQKHLAGVEHLALAPAEQHLLIRRSGTSSVAPRGTRSRQTPT